MTTLLTDEIRSWIGREVTYVSPDPVGRASMRYYAVAVGDENPIYTSDDAAQAAGFDGVVAPPTLIFDSNQWITRERDEHGNIAHLWDLPVINCRMIRGGNTYDIVRPVRPDDRLRVTWRLDDIVERKSRDGLAMLVTTSKATITDELGEVVGVNTDTIIYQEIPA